MTSVKKRYYTVRYTYLNSDDTLLSGYAEVSARDDEEARQRTIELWALTPNAEEHHDHHITSVEMQ